MSNLYAMRRANGDWFAFNEDGNWRVPVFRSSRGATLARQHNGGMMLFKPVAIDGRALREMTANDDGSAVHFWLVNNLSTDVNNGQMIEHTQLVRLMNETTEHAPS